MGSSRWYLILRTLVVLAFVSASSALLPGQAAAAAPPCADLQITGFTVSPASPVEGLPATVSITVQNAGTCAAGGFVTQFKTSISSAEGVSGTVSGLAAGASTTLALEFVFPKAGNFQTIAEVNPGNEVSETNTANNLALKAVTVQPPKVDLVVSGFSVTPVIPDPTGSVVQGRPALAAITITNNGNFPATSFQVQWSPFLFAMPLTQTVPGLAPGESTTVFMEFTFPFAGTVNETATVDPTHQVPHEMDGFENSATLETVVQPPLPNLIIGGDDEAGVQVHPAPAGDVSTMDVTVTNDGNEKAGPFLVTWQPAPLIPTQSQQVNGLPEGESITLHYSQIFLFPGTYTGTVTVDSTHEVKQVSTTGKTAETVLKVPPAEVDLTVTGVSIEPNSPIQGSPAKVTVTVENLGNSPSGNFVTDWNPDVFGLIVPAPQTLSQQSGPLGPGESRSLVFFFTYPQPGNFRSLADVNATGTVHETNTANNEEILNVTVRPQPLELVFDGPIAFSPHSPPRAKEKTTALVTVKNNGPLAAGSFAVQFAQEKEAFMQTQFLPGLNPGETKTLSFSALYSHHGNFAAKAVIDPFNQVVKTVTPDELSQTVSVVPQANVVFTTPIEFSPSPLAVAEKGTAQVTVKDEGPLATGSFFVELVPQKEGGFPQLQSVSNLEPGESRTVTFNVTYFSKGTFTAQAIIDPFNQVDKPATPVEESRSVNVVARSATLRVHLSNVQDFANPGGWQEWIVWLLAFDPGPASCTVGIKIETPISSTEFKKEFKEVTCADTEETLREPFFNPGEKRSTNAAVNVFLEEGTPLIAGTLALNICQGTCLDIGQPGLSILFESRNEYLHPPGGEIDRPAMGCEKELNGGHCYDAFYGLSVLGHVGMAARSSPVAPAAASSTASSGGAPTEAHAHSTVERALNHLHALLNRSARAYAKASSTWKGQVSVSVTTKSSCGRKAPTCHSRSECRSCRRRG